MKEMDNVKVIVEKEKYARDGVHKGMYGWICHPESMNGCWLVNFPQCGEKADIATIAIKEDDLNVVPILYAKRNEEIRAQFDAANQDPKASGDITDYMI